MSKGCRFLSSRRRQLRRSRLVTSNRIFISMIGDRPGYGKVFIIAEGYRRRSASWWRLSWHEQQGGW